MSQITRERIRLYRSIFNTRDDVFARYWEDFESKKSGYAPIYRLNQSPQALTDAVINNHLVGNQTIGIERTPRTSVVTSRQAYLA